MAPGAIQAIKAANRQDEMFVVGFDAEPDALDAIKGGELFVIITFFSLDKKKKAISSHGCRILTKKNYLFYPLRVINIISYHNALIPSLYNAKKYDYIV